MKWMSIRHQLEKLWKLTIENHIGVIVGDAQRMAHHKSKHWDIIRNHKCNPCWATIFSPLCLLIFSLLSPSDVPHFLLQHNPQQSSSRWGISSFIQQCRWLYITNPSHKGMKRHWMTGTKYIFFKFSALSNERFQWLIAIPNPFPTSYCFNIDCRTPTQTSLPPIFTQKTHGRTHLRESVYSDWWRCTKYSTLQSRHWDLIRQCKMQSPNSKEFLSSLICWLFPLMSLSDARRLQ